MQATAPWWRFWAALDGCVVKVKTRMPHPLHCSVGSLLGYNTYKANNPPSEPCAIRNQHLHEFLELVKGLLQGCWSLAGQVFHLLTNTGRVSMLLLVLLLVLLL